MKKFKTFHINSTEQKMKLGIYYDAKENEILDIELPTKEDLDETEGRVKNCYKVSIDEHAVGFFEKKAFDLMLKESNFKLIGTL